MNAAETEIRDALDRNVGRVPLRPMPPGTRLRVRRRQVGWIAGLTVITVVAASGGIALFRVLPGGADGPASGGTIVRDNPLEFVPDGWPAVDIGDPSDGYRMPASAAGAAGPVRIIASGTVDGAGFSFQSFVGGDPEVVGACLGFAGPGLDRFASPGPQPPGAVGGISSSTCAAAQGVPARADLYLAGQQSRQAPGIAADYGFVSARVARLEVRLDDGQRVDIPVLESPPGWDGLQAFLFFPPEHSAGTVTALSEDGTPLTRATICVYTGTDGGCGGQPRSWRLSLPEPGSGSGFGVSRCGR